MKKIFLSIFVITILASCNKEQLSVDKLEGTWKLTDKKVYLDDVDQQDSSLAGMTVTYTFQSCDLKSDEFCDGNVHTMQDTMHSDAAMIYNFGDDGKTLVIDYDGNASTTNDRINAEVTKLTKDEFVFEYEVTIVGTQKTVFYLEKQ